MVDLSVPGRLPVGNLSHSSMSTWLTCQEKWRRRYVASEPEIGSGAMALGKAVHAAEAQADFEQIERGERPSTMQNQEAFSDELAQILETEDFDLRDQSPGGLQDVGVAVVEAYDDALAETDFVPVEVEQEFKVEFDGVEWGFRGFIDVQDAGGVVIDRKIQARRMSGRDADAAAQPAAYLMAKRAAGEPASGFSFHTVVKKKQPVVEFVATNRTDLQIDAYVDRLMVTAAQINFAAENDVWGAAAFGSMMCSERMCGFWASCRFGGAR